MLFLRNQLSKTYQNLFIMTLSSEMTHIYDRAKTSNQSFRPDFAVGDILERFGCKSCWLVITQTRRDLRIHSDSVWVERKSYKLDYTVKGHDRKPFPVWHSVETDENLIFFDEISVFFRPGSVLGTDEILFELNSDTGTAGTIDARSHVLKLKNHTNTHI